MRYGLETTSVASPTGQEEGVARKIAELMKEFSDDITVDSMSNVYCRIKGSGNGKTVLLASHTDTIGRYKLGERLSPTIEEGEQFGKKGKVLVGAGAAAPKGAMASMLASGRALAKSGRLPGDLIIAGYVGDFFADGVGIQHMLDGFEEKGIRIDASLVSEPSDNRVVFGTRGRMEIELKVTGRPFHAGAPEKAVNAVDQMVVLLAALKSWQLPTHPRLPRATASVIDIRSLAVRPRTPHECVATIDRRAVPGEEPEGVVQNFRELVSDVQKRDPQLEAQVRLLKAMHPYETSRSDPLTSIILEVVEEVTGRKQEDYYGPFATDSGLIKVKLGIPSVSIGPGRGEDMGREHVEIAKLVEAAEIYTAFVNRVMG